MNIILNFTLIFIILCLISCDVDYYGTSPNQKILSNESNKFQFIDKSEKSVKPITVWYYKPKDLKKDAKIVFVMHGVKRNGNKYRDSWIEHAKKYNFLVLVPEFSQTYYPDARSYNLGNMFTKSKQKNDESKWTFTILEQIFDYVISNNNLTSKQYYLYGHSAGAQFVHRLFLFKSNARIKLAISANAGWYTMPDFNINFPYGLGNTDLSQDQLNMALTKTNLYILLGDKDTNTKSRYLRKTPEAIAQGAHRFERGKTFYNHAKNESGRRKIEFGWKLVIVPGVGHSNSKMSSYAAKLISDN